MKTVQLENETGLKIDKSEDNQKGNLGFDHLAKNEDDFTYIVRETKEIDLQTISFR